ncbi:MAG TPA: MerR family transcriptional regulator [Solirubrobacteraceae bacterium]|jgi:DNA-binding transcriptional MerR regulator|nr:MerR family transcriptional regulator [Solirubrobacteraceae bacterium]
MPSSEKRSAGAPRKRSATARRSQHTSRHNSTGDSRPKDGRAISARDRAPGEPASDPRSELTIEQLAAEVGMSVRNIRNHHTRGLLPPPDVRARVGYYNSEHVARLRLIQDLQADGFNLAAIERLLSGTDVLAERLLGLHRAVTAPFEPETPEVITAEELQQRFGDVSGKDAERVRRLKLLVALGDGRFEVPSPALLEAADQVVEMGIPLHASLVLIERVSRDCESISRAFAKLFLTELWEPFESAGQPQERWDSLIDAVAALRPIASETLLALFKLAMTAQLESAFGKVIEQQAKRK